MKFLNSKSGNEKRAYGYRALFLPLLFIISLSMHYGCGKKESDIKAKLAENKVANLADVTELESNGDNPLEGREEAIQNGGRHYAAMCAVCHGEGGQGNTGPDLLDDAYLHGGDNFSIYSIIMNGIRLEHIEMNPPRGKMPGYKNIFGSHRVLEVMAWLSAQKSKQKENPGN